MIKRFLSICIAAILLVGAMQLSTGAYDSGRIVLYVSLQGNDANDGSEQSPLLTLEAARDKIRELRAAGNTPAKGFVVYIRGGVYSIQKPIEFRAQDGGSEGAPVVYRAYPDEKVTFVGGVSLPADKFVPVTDSEILSRFVDKEAAKKIVQINLKELGQTEYGEVLRLGAYSYYLQGNKKPSATPELFVNGKVQTLARYPNSGNMAVDNIVHEGAKEPNMWEKNNVPEEERDATDGFIIKPNDKRYLNWTKAEPNSILMHGFFFWDWADESLPIEKIDTEKGTIESAMPSWYGIKSDKYFYVYNLLEEIDIPGEYYLDRKTGILYLYPPASLKGAEILMSFLDKPIIRVLGVNYLEFEGIKFSATRGRAFYIMEGCNNRVVNCEFEYTADTALYIDNNWRNKYNGIVDCYFHDVNGGVTLYGGNRTTLETGNNYVENCLFEDFSRLQKTYKGAISMYGTGNRASYNEIHGGPHLAIQYAGNNQIMEYNEVYDVCTETDDMSAFYAGGSWTARGTVMRYNYFHDIDSTSTGTSGVHAIYFDNCLCGQTVVGNVMENIPGYGVFINGGRDCTVFNNIMINVGNPILITDIGLTQDMTSFYSNLEKTAYREEPYKSAYPELYNILEDEPLKPKGNMFRSNLTVNCGPEKYDGTALTLVDSANNYATKKDPGFRNMDKKEYLLSDKSEVFKQIEGFQQVPKSRMGLYSDRAMMRIKDSVTLCLDSPYAFMGKEKVFLDSENKKVIPVLIDGTTYVPLRFIAEALGAEVKWDAATATVEIANSTAVIKHKIGTDELIKNGETVKLSHPTMIENNRTLLPLREISNLFGKHVYWNKIGLITISDEEVLFDEEEDQSIIRYIHEKLSIY